MTRILCLTFILSFSIFSQTNSFHTQENIKLFADYLFCEKDYIRAIEEYNRLENYLITDTIKFKLGFSYFQLKQYKISEFYFDKIEKNSSLKSLSISYAVLLKFFNRELNSIEKLISDNSDLDISSPRKLLMIGNILFANNLPNEKELMLFEDDEKTFVQKLILDKKYPDYKSPTIASLLSLIPGLGKVYTKNYTDGLTSFLLTSLFSFLAYDNFNNSHRFRGYLFSLNALGFYLGNIYGSYASAVKYNNQYDEKILNDTFEYLNQRNYFIKDVKMCD